MRIVSEPEFKANLGAILATYRHMDETAYVTGPGRSGAIAAVYTSHMTGLPFIPYGTMPPENQGRVLIVDTARKSGETIRKALRKYSKYAPIDLVVYEEPPRVGFWYEKGKR